MKKFLLSLAVTLAGSVTSFAADFTKVTDVSSLKPGDEIIVVSGSTALGTKQNSNNRDAVTVTVANNKVTLTDTQTSVQVITLASSGDTSYPWLLDVGENKYLYSPSANNYLRSAELPSGDKTGYYANIVYENNVMHIKMNRTTYEIRKNTSSALFSCYTGTQNAIEIYKNEAANAGPTKTALTLSFDPSEQKLDLGATFTAPTLSITDKDGNSVPDAYQYLTYTVEGDILAISEEGAITANTNKAGQAKISAAIKNNDSYSASVATYTLTVSDPNAITDEITKDCNFTSGYNSNTSFTGTSGVTYTTWMMKSDPNLQINAATTGFGVTKNETGFEPSSVVIEWGSTTSGRGLNVYVSNTPFYNTTSNKKDVMGVPSDAVKVNGKAYTYDGTNSKTTITLPSGYTYIGITGNGSVVYPSKITINWAKAAEKSIATPSIKFDGENNTVTLDCETEGAEIFYTTNGTAPSKASTKYYAPFTINQSCTIKAIAYVGDADSNVATYTATVTPIFDDVATLYSFSEGDFKFTLTEPVTVVYDGGKHMIVAGKSRNIDLFNNSRNEATYAPGATFSKVKGSLSIYKGLYEIASYNVTEGEQGTAPEPKEATIVDINKADLKGILCNYVELKNVNINGTTLKQGDATITLRNQFDVSDVPTSGNYDMIGVIGTFDGIQFWPISFTEVTEEPGKTKPEFRFEEDEVFIEAGDGVHQGVKLICPEGLTVAYDSNHIDVIVEDDGSLAYVISEPCDVIVTATTEGNDEYLAATASYTIHFTAPKALGALTVNGEVAKEEGSYQYVIGSNVTFAAENAESMTIYILNQDADEILDLKDFDGASYTWSPSAIGTYSVDIEYQGCNDIDEVSFDVVISEPAKVVMGDVRAHFNFHGPAANVSELAYTTEVVDGVKTYNKFDIKASANSAKEGDTNDNDLNGVTLVYDIVNISFNVSGNENHPRYWMHMTGDQPGANGTDGRIYKGNTMSIATTNGTPIKKITFYKAPATGTKWAMALDEEAAGSLDNDNLVWTPNEGESISSVTFAPSGTCIFGGFKVEYYGVMPEAKVIGLTYGEPEYEDTEDENVNIVKFNYTLHVDHHHADRADHYTLKVVLTDSKTDEEVGRGEFADHQQRVPFAAAPRRVASSSESDFDVTHQFDGVVSIPVTGEHDITATVQYAATDGKYSNEEKLVFANPITTSISEVGVGADNSEEWYDLAGRRVVAPSKGIFIKKYGNAVTKHMFQ